jgi:hypothetical protein
MPTTFTTRCDGLIAQIERIQSREADAQIVRTLESMIAELSNHLDRATKLQRTAGIFASVEGMPQPVVNANAVEALKKDVGKLTERLEKNRTQIAGGNYWANCIVKAKGLTDSLEQELNRIWVDFISAEQPGYSVFKAYRSLPTCRPILSELDRLAGILISLRRTLPEDQSTIIMVRETTALMREHIASLGLEDTPPEVEDFLKKCSADGGAFLSELTPEIFKWISAKGFAEDFRVKPR